MIPEHEAHSNAEKHDRNGNPQGMVRLADLAAAKKIPLDFLQKIGLHENGRGIEIPYFGATGEVIGTKHRTALRATDGSYWPKGKPLHTYGDWLLAEARSQRRLIFVEGESDSWASWLHKYPTLGIPGSGAARTVQAEHTECIDDIYICREPDSGGDLFVKSLRSRLSELGFTGDVYQLRMPGGIKDVADLHADDPRRFRERMDAALAVAELVHLAETTSFGETWQAPTEFPEFPAPLFPCHALPPWLRAYVKDEAIATQTPPDLGALLVISFCGSALAKKIRVLARKGWTEPLNLYTVTALVPGNRKTKVFADTTAPLKEFEREELERLAPEIAKKASQHRMLEKRLKATEERAARIQEPKDRQAAEQDAISLATELSQLIIPAQPRFFADDVTSEALGKVLADQGGRLLIASPEGGIFEIMQGRYSNSPNFEVFLKGHSGDDLRVDRIGRKSDYVEEPALSMALTVQPDVIISLASKASLRGRGLLGRFCYAIPHSTVGKRQISPPPVLQTIVEAYRTNLLAMLRIQGTTDESGRPAAHMIELSPEAQDVLQNFERWLEPQLGEGGALEHIADWGAKLAGAMVRIAGILHVASCIGTGASWMRPISPETMTAAAEIAGEYLVPHALAAFNLMGADPEVELARVILAWINRHGVERFSRADLYQHLRRRVKRVEDLNAPLARLERHHYIRRIEVTHPGPGRKASDVFEVNPACRTENSRNSANSVSDSDFVNSLDSLYGAEPLDTSPDSCETFPGPEEEEGECFEP